MISNHTYSPYIFNIFIYIFHVCISFIHSNKSLSTKCHKFSSEHYQQPLSPKILNFPTKYSLPPSLNPSRIGLRAYRVTPQEKRSNKGVPRGLNLQRRNLNRRQEHPGLWRADQYSSRHHLADCRIRHGLVFHDS